MLVNKADERGERGGATCQRPASATVDRRRVAATDEPKNEKKLIEHIVLLNLVTERPGATEPTMPLAQPI